MIDPVFTDTPQYECEQLSEQLGCHLTLKLETANPIRSFKGRGADHFVNAVVAKADPRQLVCASTGNFGQAMAYACRSRDRGVIVYADDDANPLKIARIRALGAEVRQVGHDFDAAKDAARKLCDETGAWMVEDGREPEISEGAGSIAVELLEAGAFDAVLVPVGNGALIAGVSRWVKARSPDTMVIGVSVTGADSMAVSWAEGKVVTRGSVDTIAEGIAVRVPVPEALTDMADTVDDMVLVDDATLVEGMRLLYSCGQISEPAATAGIAAIVESPARFSGQRVATVVTGSNATPEQTRVWLG